MTDSKHPAYFGYQNTQSGSGYKTQALQEISSTAIKSHQYIKKNKYTPKEQAFML